MGKYYYPSPRKSCTKFTQIPTKDLYEWKQKHMNYAKAFYHMNEIEFGWRNLCPIKSPTLVPLKYNVYSFTSGME